MSSSDTYSDPWQTYRLISAKLKKRFLRKPNVAEGVAEFSALSRRFVDDQCPDYAGLCQLAIARCERQIQNFSGETEGLAKAARFFMQAQTNHHELGLPSFNQNLNSAVHCYGHAVKTHVELKQISLAASLSLELGVHLYALDRPFEAIEHFERASRYFESDPINVIQSLSWLALCQSEEGKFDECLRTVNQLWNLALSLGNQPEVLKNCEIATLLLLLELEAEPNQMTDRQQKVMEMYRNIEDPNTPLPPAASHLNPKFPTTASSASDSSSAAVGGVGVGEMTAVSVGDESEKAAEEEFLLLQSLVESVRWNDAAGADAAVTQLWPTVKSGFIRGLAMDIVDKLYKDDFQSK